MKRIIFLLKVFAILILFILPTMLNSAPMHEKHIVVIHSFYSELTANREIDKSIEKYAQNVSSTNIYIHTIYLDSSNMFALSPRRIARRTLRKLELFEQIDGFIIIGKPAFETMIHDEFKKFADVATVFLSNSELVINTNHFFSNFLCLNEDINVAPTLDLALDLFPTAKKIEIIANNNSPVVEEHFRLLYQNLLYFNKMPVTFLPDMNITEYGEYIENIKEETIILLSDYVFSDEPHRVSDNDLAFYLTKNPNLRVFTTYKHLINYNFIGGFVVDFQKLGSLSISTLFDLINNKKNSSYNEVINMSNQYYFNRDALKEYNISIDKLPANYRFTYKFIGKKIKAFHYHIALLSLSLGIIILLIILLKKLSHNERCHEELRVMQKLLAYISSKLHLPYWYQTSEDKKVIKSTNLKYLLSAENTDSPPSLEEFLAKYKLTPKGEQKYVKSDHIFSTHPQDKASSTYHYFMQGSPEESLGFFHNITDRLIQEDNYNAANHLNRIILKSIDEAVISISQDWKIEWYNQATIDLIRQITKPDLKALEFDQEIANLLYTQMKLKTNLEKLKDSSPSLFHLEEAEIDLKYRVIPNFQHKGKIQSHIIIISTKSEADNQITAKVFSSKLADFFSSLPNFSAWTYQQQSDEITFSENFASIADQSFSSLTFSLTRILSDLECKQNKDSLQQINHFLHSNIETISIDLLIVTLNNEEKMLRLKGKKLVSQDTQGFYTAIGFLKDITAEVKNVKENSELKDKLSHLKEVQNKELYTIRQEMITEKLKLKEKIKSLSADKSYLEANLDFLVHQGKMKEIEALIRGISNEFNEPLSVLKLSNEVLTNEIEIMLENLTSIIPKLNESEISLLASITEKITRETTLTNIKSSERVEDIVPSLRNMEEMEFATISKVSKLIVNIGLQANLKAIKPLISHPENEKILSFLMTIKNIVKLKHNINFDIDDLSRISYSLKGFVETSNPKAMGKCNLVKIIHKTLTYFKYQLKDNIELELSLPEKLDIICNPDDFVTLLSNIIQNSLDALENEENGKIKISISDFDSKIVVRVTDNGPGIDDNSKQHLFEPFYTTKGFDKGIGLGLVIAKHITDNHNAKLEIDSSENGTNVSIYLAKGK